MFTLIQQTYYSHINEDTLKKLPQLDPLKAALDDTEKGFNATKFITEAAEDVYSGRIEITITTSLNIIYNAK